MSSNDTSVSLKSESFLTLNLHLKYHALGTSYLIKACRRQRKCL